jgi:hypothetical protein
MLTTIIVYSVMAFATVMVCDFTQTVINCWVHCWQEYHAPAITELLESAEALSQEVEAPLAEEKIQELETPALEVSAKPKKASRKRKEKPEVVCVQ